MDYELSETYKQIAEAVIDAVPALHWIRSAGVRISYERSFVDKKSAGRDVLGECKKVKPEWQLYCPYDFRIIIYKNNITGLSENQIKILLWHELQHIGISEKDGELEYKIVPHDVEDFHSILDRFGTRWSAPGTTLPDITEGGG